MTLLKHVEAEVASGRYINSAGRWQVRFSLCYDLPSVEHAFSFSCQLQQIQSQNVAGAFSFDSRVGTQLI